MRGEIETCSLRRHRKRARVNPNPALVRRNSVGDHSPVFLAELHVENFRGFGSEADGEHLALSLHAGLNVLVGENDSGKSSILDAVRLLLSARGQDSLRLTDDDFHVKGAVKAASLTVRGTFRGLSVAEQSRFLEWLTAEGKEPVLTLTLQATRRDLPGRSRRIFVTTRAGRTGDGPPLEGEIRDFLQATYLRPLRDAEAELSGGRGSRLSQILEAHPAFKTHTKDDSNEEKPATLVGIMRKAERMVQESDLVTETATKLSVDYLKPLSIGPTPLTGTMGIARNIELRQVLDKLELWLAPDDPKALRTRRGLGLNNVLFMAAELLLLAGEPDASLPLLLIEEPEAHLHPQLQARLIEFFERRSEQPKPIGKGSSQETAPQDSATDGRAPSRESGGSAPPEAPASPRAARDGSVQILLTTHSPHFASSINIERMILVSGRRCYRLAQEETKLAALDYAFLRRFLDVTKANLFFARGVLIVEGDAENLLLPVIARKLGRPFSQHGVSIVNVGSRALFRYAHIFQRSKGAGPDVRVACLADLDIVPAEVTYAKKESKEEDGDEEQPGAAYNPEKRSIALKKHDGGAVKTFVSPHWTLEHDLARCGLAREVHRAIFVGAKSLSRAKNAGAVLTTEERAKAEAAADAAFKKLEGDCDGDSAKLAASVYEPLYKRRASKAEVAEILAKALDEDARTAKQLRRALPGYLVEAIEYVTRADAEATS